MVKSSMIFFLVLLNLNGLHAQTKYEKEDRIKASEVPPAAIDFVDQLGFVKKIKWYIEEGLDRMTYEAKTKHRSKKYSIEFSKNGNIEDIEIEIKMDDVEFIPNAAIVSHLVGSYTRFKICKVQRQYTGPPSEMMTVTQDGVVSEQLTINYEVVAKVKKDKVFQEMEFLYDSEGRLISEVIIVQKNTDHLEY